MGGGEEDVMQGGPAPEYQHRLAGRSMLDRVGEERDRLALVRLDDGVVVGQVLLRHPIRVEGGAPRPAEQPARQARENVLVAGGAEVRSRQEEQRLGRRDGLGQDRGAERAGVVGRLLGDLGRHVPGAGRDPLRPGSSAPGELEGGLRDHVGAGPGPAQEQPVGPQVRAQRDAPHDIRADEDGERERVGESAQQLGRDQQHAGCRGHRVECVCGGCGRRKRDHPRGQRAVPAGSRGAVERDGS
jgi:hypothetical protein